MKKVFFSVSTIQYARGNVLGGEVFVPLKNVKKLAILQIRGKVFKKYSPLMRSLGASGASFRNLATIHYVTQPRKRN